MVKNIFFIVNGVDIIWSHSTLYIKNAVQLTVGGILKWRSLNMEVKILVLLLVLSCYHTQKIIYATLEVKHALTLFRLCW